jgi:NitT/TauT family transport system ATP-binding protein
MLLGTVIGVLVIPGLYYLFGKIADGRKLLKDETHEPLSETFEAKVFEPLPDVTAGEIEGLLEYLYAHGGQDDVFHIAAETDRDSRRLISVAKAAELLAFVTTPGRQVVLDHGGTRFVTSSRTDRKGIWRLRILQLRLFRLTQEMLRRADGPIDSEVVKETLILNLPEENYEEQFATFIDWTRYGELFAYDETTGQISMP